MWRACAGLLLPLLLLPAVALADERFDHRGAVALLVGGGGSILDVDTPVLAVHGNRGLVDLGGTWAIGYNGNELLGQVRVALGGTVLDWSVMAGYRGYFGYDRLKTFLDVQLVALVKPTFLIGPRLGGGVQFELTPNVGVFAGLGFQIGAGTGLLFSRELFGGIQLRSYLLEP